MELFALRRAIGPRAVVFLHGFGGSHEAWTAVTERLPAALPIIAYDLPGHAGSGAFADAGSPRKAAQAVIDDLVRHGVTRAHLVGHSMGGAIAALCALTEPARVSGLTLMAPGGFGPEINHRLLTRFAAAATADEMEACLEGMYGYLSPLPDNAVAGALRTRALPGQLALLKRMAAGLAREGRQGTLPLDALDALGLPVSVIWGELDNVLPFRQTRAMPARFGRHCYADLGHMLPDEAPEEMAAIVATDAEAGWREPGERG